MNVFVTYAVYCSYASLTSDGDVSEVAAREENFDHTTLETEVTVIDCSAKSEEEGPNATFIVNVISSMTNCEGTCCSVVEISGSLILLHCPVLTCEEPDRVALEAGALRAAKFATSLLGYG